jgi:hypothetical protein
MNSVRTFVCVFLAACSAAITHAQPQFDLTPIHPVVGSVEAVGSGQFGRCSIRVGVPFVIPGACGAIVGSGGTNGDGNIELVFSRRDGASTGSPVPVRNIDLRAVIQQTAAGDTSNLNVFGAGAIFEINLAPYLLAAPPDAELLQVRTTPQSTQIYECCGGGNCFPTPNAIFSLKADSDGVGGSPQPTDSVDKRFQIVRDRGSLQTAEIHYDNSTWLAELRLTFVFPGAGPALQASPSLRSPDNLWAPASGTGPMLVSNPNDTNPAELTASDLEVYNLFGPGWRSPANSDVSSFSVTPKSSTLSIYFDRKTSRLWNNGMGFSIRCSANSNVRDCFGNRVRSNDVSVQFVSCPAAPSAFQLLVPSPNAQAVGTTNPLQWAASPCAQSYNVRVATDPGMSNVVVNADLAFNEYPLASTPLNLNTRYYWQVTATNVNGQTTNLGGVQTFRTLIPGDLNADGVVNVADLTQFLGNFGTSVP